eukprot:7275447-Ditylum_brightwellii.AAC.1
MRARGLRGADMEGDGGNILSQKMAHYEVDPLSDFNNVKLYPFTMYLPVINFNPLDMDRENFIPFTVRISATMVTFIHPTSGPHIPSTAMILVWVIGKFGRRLLSTKW